MSRKDSVFNSAFPVHRNYNILKNNKSTGNYSIDKVQLFQRKIRINSPMSKRAMKELGYNISDLEFVTIKEYIRKNPVLIGKTKNSQQIIYSYIERLRSSRLQKIKDLRNKLKTQTVEEEKMIKNNSCLNLRKKNPKNINVLMSNSVDEFGTTALEKEKKTLEEIKYKNKAGLINKIQFELNNELIKKKNEDKLEQQYIKYRNFLLEKDKKRKDEESQKLNREMNMIKKKGEFELLKMKIYNKILDEKIQNAKEKEKLELKRIKEVELKKREDELQNLLSHRKFEERLEIKKLEILEKAKILEIKEANKKKQIELKNKAQQELNKKKSLEKKIHMEETLKNYEMKLEEIQRQYKIKEIENKEKEKRLELLAKIENEKKLENYKRKQEEIKLILERNKAIKQKKIDNYNEKQKKLALKREIMEKNNEIKKLEKMQQKEENEQKIHNTLNKNKFLINQRKNKIIKEIKLKEYNTQQVWKKKLEKNEKNEEILLGKRIVTEFKVKEKEQQKINMLYDKEIKLNNRDEKIKNFLEQKHMINEQKKTICEEINNQKKLYSERIQNLFDKGTINKKTLNQIKNNFSYSPQITKVIDKFDKLMENKK